VDRGAGLAYARIYAEDDEALRRGFGWAFATYVGGALGTELPLGAWYERYGDEDLGYAVLDSSRRASRSRA
jgi:hypothetical protein